jgi:hypothetical protein
VIGGCRDGSKLNGCFPEQLNLPFLEGSAPALPKNLEGEAPAEPNLSANREIGKSASRETTASGEAISEW